MLDQRNVVEKSKSLVWAQFQDYGVGELKILDTYLSRINARKPESSLVTFTKREYADLMGIDPDVRTSQLKTYTKRLLSNVVTLDLPGHGYVQYPLFSEARCFYDESLKQVVVQVECNEKLKDAFFGIAQNGYIKYQLKNIIALTSQYSVRLYPRLKDRPYGWTVEVDELRELMGATAKTYAEFKRFNSLVLQKAVKEICAVTDIVVSAETIKKGRNVVAIKFDIALKDNVLLDEDQLELPMGEEAAAAEEPFVPDIDDPLGMTLTVLPKHLTREQAELLHGLANDHVPYTVMNFTEKQMWISDYIQNKVQLMKAQGKPVKEKGQFGWLRRAIDEDWK